MKKIFSLTCFALLILSIPVLAKIDNASTSSLSIDDTTSKSVINPQDVKEGELAVCFDYYKFGKLTMGFGTRSDSYQAGDPVLIEGGVVNQNNYPLVKIDVKARIVKNISNSRTIILDEFDVASDITLAAKKEFKISHNYILPLNAPAGEYQIMLYAVENGQFNLGDVSFRSGNGNAKILFFVEGNKIDHIYLDQAKIMLGEKAYVPDFQYNQHESDGSMPITVPIYNPSNEERKMKVTYDLYSTNSYDITKKLNTKSEVVTVPAKSQIKLTYIVNKVDVPVYYLSITAEPSVKTKNTSIFREKTIANVKFFAKGQAGTKINFSGVDSYPLKDGKEVTLITCFSNTDGDDFANNKYKIESVLFDQNKIELSRILYEGKAFRNTTGLISKFTPTKDISDFYIITTTYDSEGKIIDTIEKNYSCNDIDANVCIKPDEAKKPLSIMIVGVMLLISIMFIGLIFKIYHMPWSNMIF